MRCLGLLEIDVLSILCGSSSQYNDPSVPAHEDIGRAHNPVIKELSWKNL
jgi:hypothetical protein